MVKKFTTECDFSGQKSPITFYIGDPAEGSHPLGFQSKWLGKARGGVVPEEVMNAFSKLREISEKNHVPFADLCAYVVDELNSGSSLTKDAKQATAIAGGTTDNNSDESEENKEEDEGDK